MRRGSSDGDERSEDEATSRSAIVEVDILIDSSVVEAYQAKWPDWREKMAEILSDAAKKL